VTEDQAGECPYGPALALAEAGDNEAALHAIREHLLRHPKDGRALNDAGAMLFSLGRLSEAAEHLRAALDHLDGEERSQALANLVEVYLAVATTVHGAGALPFNYDCLMGEAGAMEADGDHYRAARLYEKMRQAYSNVLVLKALQARALYNAGGHDDEALRLCREVNAVAPAAETLLLEGRLHRRADRLEEAVSALEQARGRLEGSD
jgi:tetratricopeptide (TPR) repeat protein